MEIEFDTNYNIPEFSLSTIISYGFMKIGTFASDIIYFILYMSCMQIIYWRRSSPPFTTTLCIFRLSKCLKLEFFLYESFF